MSTYIKSTDALLTYMRLLQLQLYRQQLPDSRMHHRKARLQNGLRLQSSQLCHHALDVDIEAVRLLGGRTQHCGHFVLRHGV